VVYHGIDGQRVCFLLEEVGGLGVTLTVDFGATVRDIASSPSGLVFRGVPCDFSERHHVTITATPNGSTLGLV